MRLPDKNSLLNAGPLALIAALAACGGGGGTHPPTSIAPATQGPAADYPVVVGDPFTVDGVTYTPSDALNYDEVGYATLDDGAPDAAISAAHRTLPLPSYAEVTSLETGHTILVRVERRGPMTGPFLVALSDGAAKQLGITASTPIRVRRVNPPEQERAMLRRGEAAPERMATPESLVEVLRRKLPAEAASASLALPDDKPSSSTASDASVPSGQTPSVPVPSAPLPVEIDPSSSVQPDELPVPVAPAAAEAKPEPAPKPAPPIHKGFAVQAGAYSTVERARRVADGIGGHVEKVGTLWHVRTGPFATRNEAQASLAKVIGKGYSDARIYRTD